MTNGNILDDLCAGHDLSTEEAQALFDDIFSGRTDPARLAALLTALRIKGETPDEIAGAARAMVAAATPFPRPAGIEIGEIVGTGGDGARTINVSTTCALIAAGSGLFIAKHGNRGVSSPSGASDVLSALGVDIRPEPAESARLLTETGFCFCFAQRFHPGMRFAGPVRASLRMRTIFNVLGPLTNPARPDYALIGVYDPALLETIAVTLRGLGLRRALVVHGAGLDEAAVHGETQAVELLADGSLRRHLFLPADFGVASPHALEDVRGGTPEENARITEEILSGRGTTAQRDIVAANLALLLLLGGRAQTLPDAVAASRQAMADRAGLTVLEAHRAFARRKTDVREADGRAA